MGFCSGTDIFDPVVGYILKSDLSDEVKEELIWHLVDALYDHDWDCETDSRYWNDPIVRKVFKRFPSWDDEESEG